MGKRGRIAATLMALAGVGVAGLATVGRQPPVPLPLQPLDEAIGSELASGWRLAQSPDLPGPYRWGGLPHQTAPGQGGGKRWRNRVSEAGHRFTPLPGVEQLAVPLETADGLLTVAIFAR